MVNPLPIQLRVFCRNFPYNKRNVLLKVRLGINDLIRI